jgi:hypothetical protein
VWVASLAAAVRFNTAGLIDARNGAAYAAASAIPYAAGQKYRVRLLVNLPAKKKAMRTKRGIGTRAARRKAYVYLAAGDTIQFA